MGLVGVLIMILTCASIQYIALKCFDSKLESAKICHWIFDVQLKTALGVLLFWLIAMITGSFQQLNLLPSR